VFGCSPADGRSLPSRSGDFGMSTPAASDQL
jgi:hypothetical protein